MTSPKCSAKRLEAFHAVRVVAPSLKVIEAMDRKFLGVISSGYFMLFNLNQCLPKPP